MLSAAAIASLIAGVLAEVPAAIDAYNEIKAVAASGKDPTADQWKSWNDAADLAADAVDFAAGSKSGA